MQCPHLFRIVGETVREIYIGDGMGTSRRGMIGQGRVEVWVRRWERLFERLMEGGEDGGDKEERKNGKENEEVRMV